MWNWKRNSLLLVLFFLFVAGPELSAQEAELIVYSPDQSLQLVAKQNLGRTRINIFEPQGQGELHSWEIKDFTAETVQFTKSYPKRLLIASDKTIYVYDLSDKKKKLILTQPVGTGKSIVDAGFAEDEQEIYWSTKKELLTSDIKEAKPKKIHEVKDGLPIKELTALKDKRVVVSQEGKKDLTLINTKKPESPTTLKGHKENVVGVASPDGQNLYSLDEEDELARWDLLNNEVSLKQQLSKTPAKPVAMNIDASGKNILVKYKEDGLERGVKYSIDSIEDLSPKGTRVSFTKGFGKKLFEAPAASQPRSIRSAFSESEKEADSPREGRKRKIPYYQLAAIEAENQNFEAALRYIKQVSLTSPDYAASRKLQRDVYSQLEVKAQLAGAMDQYKRGSLDSAKVLVRSTLAKYPNHPVALRYKKMIENKEQEQFLSSLVTTFLILGGFGLFGLLVYRRRDKVRHAASNFKPAAAKTKEPTERKKFVILYQQTRGQLKKLTEHDKRHLMTTTWKAVESQLELIERKSRQPQVNYARLNEELTAISQDLSKRFQELKSKLAGAKSKTKNAESEEKAKNSKEKTQEKAKKSSSQKETKGEAKGDPNIVDFYELLGVKPTATEAEIKKAYRTKIKQYHPDHHDASSFKWVKEEAGRMTQKLGEAYEILRDPKQRAKYDNLRKQQGK